jgi:hypothetical protein
MGTVQGARRFHKDLAGKAKAFCLRALTSTGSHAGLLHE